MAEVRDSSGMRPAVHLRWSGPCPELHRNVILRHGSKPQASVSLHPGPLSTFSTDLLTRNSKQSYLPHTGGEGVLDIDRATNSLSPLVGEIAALGSAKRTLARLERGTAAHRSDADRGAGKLS